MAVGLLVEVNMTNYNYEDRIIASIEGFTVADALGVPIEFTSRSEHTAAPLKEMVGYGSHMVPAGTWSDDSSMVFATIDSINHSNGIDYDDMMNRFLEWRNHAKYTATDEVFDIGISTEKALSSYLQKKTDALHSGGTSIMDNGNGSLMRILPVAIYISNHNIQRHEAITIINNVSSLTHAHEISKMGCLVYSDMINFVLRGYSIHEAYSQIREYSRDYYSFAYSCFYSKETVDKYARIMNRDISKAEESAISSSGYVVSTLEAVLWVCLNAHSYEEAVVKAINLGDDTDTVGALTGGLTGAYYGKNAIPENWISKMKKRSYLEEFSKSFVSQSLVKNPIKTRFDVL